MSLASSTESCRVTVVGTQRRADLALPTIVSLAALLPAILMHAGLGEETARQAAGGWVLQRLGEAPFPLDKTPLQAGLRDGDLIYLRPREAALPEPAYDDMADAIAVGVTSQPDRWQSADARRVAIGAGLAGLAAGAAVLALSGPPWQVPALAATVMTVVLLAAAAVVGRAVGDGPAAAALGFASLPYALLAGLLWPAPSLPLTHLGAPEMMAGLAAALLAAAVAAGAVGAGRPVLYGAAGAALLGVAAAAAGYLAGGIGLPGAAACVAAVALALTPVLPALAFRTANLSLPPVPGDASELRADTYAVNGSEVHGRTAAADRFVTGAVAGIGMTGAVAGIALAFGHGWLPRVTCAALGCALLLRSRVFRGRAQRLWLQIPGYTGLTLLAVGAVTPGAELRNIAVVLPSLVAGAAALAAAGIWLPGRRPSPFWGRAADIADMALIVSLIPLALGTAGLFSYIRGLSG